MVFPTDRTIPQIAVQTLLSRARSLRSDAAKYIVQCDSGVLNVHDVASSFMANHLSPAKTEITIIAAIPGIYDQLVEAKPNTFIDTTAAQNAVEAVQTAIDDMIAFLETNLPVDSERRILSLTLSDDGSGTLTQRTITGSGAIASFKSQLELFRDFFEA